MSLAKIEQSVCDLIAARAEQLVADLSDHVAIPTGGDYRPGLDGYRRILGARLTTLSAKKKTIPGQPRPEWLQSTQQISNNKSEKTREPPATTIFSHHTDSSTPRILLAGHLDTVHDPHGPFQKLTISDDSQTATGPGVVDMKGGILIAVTALEALTELNVKLNWTFLLNADEERGSFHSAGALGDAAAKHDFGIALEPALADGSLAVERMGSGQFRVEAFGRSAHVGRAFEQGVSAVTALANVLIKLSEMPDAANGLIVNVGPLQGGPVTNVVPDYAACWGNVRYGSPQAGEKLAEMIDALATEQDAVPRIVAHRQWNRPAKPLTDEVQQFAETARTVAEDLGQSLPFASTGGVCDGNILQAAGLPTIDTLGVRGGNLHRPDEFIELPSLVERCQLLAVLLLRIGAQSTATA